MVVWAIKRARNEKLSKVRELQELNCVGKVLTESAGLVLANFCNLFRNLTLSPNLRNDKDFARLADVLFLHGFLPFREAF